MAEATTEVWSVLRMVRWATDYFRERGVDSPRLTIEMMLSHILAMTRFELYVQFERPLSPAELDSLRSMIKRRVAREPLQYILGEAWFHGRRFDVNPSVLIPRPETELLVDETLRRCHALRCLDIGTGSGCIGITIAAERPDTEVVAIDVSPDAIDVARGNAERLGVGGATFYEVDLFDDEAMRSLGSFDLIISNPPYIAAGEIPQLQFEVREHEPHRALTPGDDPLVFYRRLADSIPWLLRDPADIFVEVGAGQARKVAELFRVAGLRVDILTDLERIERIVWAQRR